MSIVIVIVSVCSPVNADGTLQQASDAVIDTELRDILLGSVATDQIPVNIWLYDPVSFVELETAISSRIGVTREQLTTNKTRTVTSKEVDAYIETERSLYAEKMNQYYNELLKDYSNVKALCETREGKRLFFSQYAPMISAELTPQEIKQLAADSRVEAIYYSPRIEVVNASNKSFPTIGANYTRDTLGYTGSGIRIGMIELGVPDISAPYFTTNSITCDDNNATTERAHANHVASIMVGKETTLSNGVTYEGIVPDATLYAAHCGDNIEWMEQVEWLLSKNVHVINMSMGFPTVLAKYSDLDKWLDHIAINHSVHVVVASGNYDEEEKPNYKVLSPAMAYNALTVGAIDDNNSSANYNDDSLAEYSCWTETEGTNKPDLVAPGTLIYTAASTDPNKTNGTSFAAPHVTAVVAQLCQRKPELKLLQDAMKAILTASVSHSEIRYNTMDGDTNLDQVNTNYNQCGAGVVNARSAFSTVIESRYESGSFAANSGDGTQVMYTFNVTNTEKIVRVSLSWLKNSVFPDGVSHKPQQGTSYEPTPDIGSLANLNLYIYDSEGQVVYNGKEVKSKKIGINTEIVEFRPTRTGTHRIYIRQSSDSNKRVYYGVAWWHPMSS